MIKKLVVGGLVVVACLWVAKKSNVLSYATTLIAQGKERLHAEIPRDFEITRVKSEIQRLDRDYLALLGPIAEKKAAVRRLEGDVVAAKGKLSERREALLALTQSIDGKEKEIAYQGCNYTLSQAKVRLAQDFAFFKKSEASLATQEKLLDAERQNLIATIDQLGKLVEQKREFEIALAQIEADEAVLRAQSVVTPLRTDDGRVADIANTLKELQQAQDVERERRLLAQQYGSKIGDAQPQIAPVGDLTAIRDHLEGKTGSTTKVATSGK